jgi:pilus assembly protein CpaC
MKQIIIIFILTLAILNANKLEDISTFEEKIVDGHTITFENNSYKILKFNKSIQDIRFSKRGNLSLEFIDIGDKAFSHIKIFSKKTGIVNALITFEDKSTTLIVFNITANIQNVQLLIKKIAKDVELTQINKSLIIKGKVKNNKIRNKILMIVQEALTEVKVIDLLEAEEPDKMVRLKLYVTEINNEEGEVIKNNWSYNKNDGSTTYDVSTQMLNSVTLSGGLTAMANKQGSNFNAQFTLNYLKSKGVARILDETTLITLENKSSEFLAGGTLLIETSSTSADGQPISAISTVNYGLELKINAKEIIDEKYVNLEISTSSSSLDKANGVGSMPAKKDKSIKTNVLIEDRATVVLGGLINNTNSRNLEKIPLLGDLPILGALFRSKDFQEGKSELIFFITPTIVTVNENDQGNRFTQIRDTILSKENNESKNKENIENTENNETVNTENIESTENNETVNTENNESIVEIPSDIRQLNNEILDLKRQENIENAEIDLIKSIREKKEIQRTKILEKQQHDQRLKDLFGIDIE